MRILANTSGIVDERFTQNSGCSAQLYNSLAKIANNMSNVPGSYWRGVSSYTRAGA
jgi:hypothetical protein